MARGQVTVHAGQVVIYDGSGEVTCDARDTPHGWDVRLRCSPDELDAFRSLGTGDALQVEVGGAGQGRAQFAAVEEPRHVRLTGRGFCPYPNH